MFWVGMNRRLSSREVQRSPSGPKHDSIQDAATLFGGSQERGAGGNACPVLLHVLGLSQRLRDVDLDRGHPLADARCTSTTTVADGALDATSRVLHSSVNEAVAAELWPTDRGSLCAPLVDQ